jgi:pimeloyl-ACP methyl ester carboxylesterase
LPARLGELASVTGRPVSVIGWSLGGIYARELARQRPGQVRRVITLGSPFALTDPRQSHADRAYRRRSQLHAADRVPTREELGRPIDVPSTAVYSRRDGIVSWRTCIEPETDLHQNVEVRCAHLGFGVDPATLWLIADRLAVPVGRRQQFRAPAALRSLYPVRDARQE